MTEDLTIVFRPDDLPLPESEPALKGYGKALRAHFAEAQQRLQAWHEAGASGPDIVFAWTAVVDRVIVRLFELAAAEYHSRNVTSQQQFAVLAQGGYGRGELNPQSDLDLLFLHSWKVSPFVESVTERILYTLWDAGVQVGQAVRNVSDCTRLAAKDFKIKTALIDTRFLCGDRALADEFQSAMKRDVLMRNSKRFFEDKIAETKERHASFGDTVYLQEPQLKEGEGGLRDLHTAFWMAQVKYKIDHPSEVVQRGIITQRELDAVLAARDFVWRVRNSLHFLTGKHQDQLLFDLQEPVAEMLGYRSDGELGPVENFLHDLYLQGGVIQRFSRMIVDRATETLQPYRRFGRPYGRELRPGVRILGRQISIEQPEILDQEPAALIGLFADAQRHNVAISPVTLAEIRARVAQVAEHREAPDLIEKFLSILTAPDRVTETLRAMYESGILGAFIPEFEELRCMVIRDLHHLYTVDEHTLRGVRFLEQLAAGELRTSAPLLTQVVYEIDRLEVVYVAMLLHDIGKGHGYGHSERGAESAAEVARRMGFNADDVTMIEHLVRLHLLMSHISQHRDLEDEQEILKFAQEVGSIEVLSRLYVMTFADMSSVAPTVWNTWRDLELGELYLRALDVFQMGDQIPEPREQRAERIQGRVREAIEMGSPELSEPLGRFLPTMPASYFVSTPEDLVPEHVRLMERFCASEDIVETLVRRFPKREFTEFSVCTNDRPGVFSLIAGVLAAHGMNVLGAVITTSSEEVALDVFRVLHGPLGQEHEEERWNQIRTSLEGVLVGTVAVADLLAKKQSSLPRKKTLRELTTRLSVENPDTGHYTLVEVSTRNEVGLLFAITQALYELECRIHIAKISTVLDYVHDVFYITDTAGRKISDPEQLAAIERLVRSRIGDNTDGESEEQSAVGE